MVIQRGAWQLPAAAGRAPAAISLIATAYSAAALSGKPRATLIPVSSSANPKTNTGTMKLE